MNNLEIFKSEEFGEVRTSVVNNEPYFMLNDICKVLEINNSSQARTRSNEDGVISNEVIDSLGRKQRALFIKAQLKDGYRDWLEGNVLKYMFRWRNKNGIEDLKKAQENLRMFIGEMENEERVVKGSKKQHMVPKKLLDPKTVFNIPNIAKVPIEVDIPEIPIDILVKFQDVPKELFTHVGGDTDD